MSVEAQRQEKLDTTEERDFRKEMLLGKYTAKVLYRWDNGKFKDEYLRKLERSWAKLKGRDKTRWGDNSSSGVVATTRHSRTNDLTTSKALSRAIK